MEGNHLIQDKIRKILTEAIAHGDNKKSRIIGYVICSIQFLVGIMFVVSIFRLKMIPAFYLGILIIVLLLILFAGFWAQFKSKKHAIIAKCISGGLTIILLIGFVHCIKLYDTLMTISGADIQLDNMVLAVRIDDEAEDIFDISDYIIGVEGDSETEELEGLNGYIQIVVDEIEVLLEGTLQIAEYDSLNAQVEALESGEIDAIIYNDAYTAILEDEITDFGSTIKVLFEHGIEVVREEDNSNQYISVEEEVFTVYISGIDTYGSITNTSRSDVNIVAVVNPTTEQILLVSTPRDYYVTLTGQSGDSKDKLTHAGIYGIDVSEATLETIYDVEIDFYARVNFTSLVNMVDALGGISVYSSQSFWTTKHDGVCYYIEEGYNDLSGIEALYFARERYNLANGDYQRGENHEELIKAMIEKVTSPAIITSAYDLLDSISGNLDTDMSMEQLQDFIKMQIDEDIDWDIIMMTAEGTDGSAMCYSYGGGELSVVYPDEDSIATISEAINTVMNGEILVIEE